MLLKRKVNAVEAANKCTVLLKNCCDEIGEKFTKVQGFIPDCNRAAKRFVIRAGYTDLGIVENMFFYNKGKKCLIRLFELEV
jgi:hypothetical protein